MSLRAGIDSCGWEQSLEAPDKARKTVRHEVPLRAGCGASNGISEPVPNRVRGFSSVNNLSALVHGLCSHCWLRTILVISTLSARGFQVAKSTIAVVVCASLLLGCQQEPPVIEAETAKNYYSGKTVTYIIASEPGGGYDAYGRLIAKYMQKHLQGSRFVIRYVTGAGHIIAANTLYNSPPDGLTIGMFNTALIYSQLLNIDGVRFELSSMSWIGKAANDTRVVVISTNSPYASFNEILLSQTPIRFAAGGVGSPSYLESRVLNSVFPEISMETIAGFSGSEGQLAMLRGEVTGQLGTESSYKQFVESGNAYYALAMSKLAAESLPDVPIAAEYVHDAQNLQLLGLLETLSDLGRLTVGPPNIPPALLSTLRRAFDEALVDPELMAEAERVGYPITYGSGQYVERRIKEVLTQKSETIALLAAAASNK